MLRTTFVTALLLSTGCIQVNAEIPKACFLQTGVMIDALEVDGVAVATLLEEAQRAGLPPPANLIPEGGAQETFTREGLDEIPQAFDDLGASGEIRLLFVEVDATAGLESFEQIQSVAVSVRSPSGQLQPFVLAVCDRNLGCDTSGSRVTLAADAERDLMPYLREGTLEFTLELNGIPPLDAWQFDVDICMDGVAGLSAGL